MKHQQSNQNQVFVPRSTAYEKGKYGRLFPWLPPLGPDTDERQLQMVSLAKLMKANAPHVDSNSIKPAGYTYFGQFIAHDLTFDATTIKEQQLDPEKLYNFRTPSLDLDSIYGGGPLVQPYLYEKTGSFPYKFLHQKVATKELPNDVFWDLPRLPNGMAVIADPRNDENLITSQLQVAFQLLHNHFAEGYKAKGLTDDKVFERAQRDLRWHYQFLIIHDYLPNVLDNNILKEVISSLTEANQTTSALRYYDWRNEPYVPLEFSGALFRFGHSQVRDRYQKKNGISFELFEKVEGTPPQFMISWDNFFSESKINQFHLINPNIAKSLFAIESPGRPEPINLAEANLLRGLKLQLPSGQSIVRAMGLNDYLLDSSTINYIEQKYNDATFSYWAAKLSEAGLSSLIDDTPLWFYTLLEARIFGKGEHLGPMASRLIAEVILGILKSDKTSYLNQEPFWKPNLVNNNAEDGSKISIKELLEAANLFQGAKVK